jgi:hypothetical protein
MEPPESAQSGYSACACAEGVLKTVNAACTQLQIIVFCEGGYNGAKDIQPAIQYCPH